MKKKASGFTLVEILVTILIMFFITAGIYGVSNVGERTYSTDMGLLELQQQARQSMSGMARELRQNDAADLTIGIGGEDILFRIPRNISQSPVTYYQDIEYEKVGTQIIRRHAGIESILANDINSLNFCCWKNGACGTDCTGADFLQVQLSAQKVVNTRTVSFPANGTTITEKVKLRNF